MLVSMSFPMILLQTNINTLVDGKHYIYILYIYAMILCLIILIMFSDLIKNMIVAQLGSTFDTFLFYQLIVLQEMHNQARKFSIYPLLPAPVSRTKNKWNVDSLPEDAILIFFLTIS